ncbi:hypothetical protein ACVWYY_000441 [Thermostichus sp. MS-CIW-34]|jgi:hypothetical protein
MRSVVGISGLKAGEDVKVFCRVRQGWLLLRPLDVALCNSKGIIFCPA